MAGKKQKQCKIDKKMEKNELRKHKKSVLHFNLFHLVMQTFSSFFILGRFPSLPRLLPRRY